MHRRELLQTAMTLGGASLIATGRSASADGSDVGQKLIDTHVNLFQWPFRRLPLDQVTQLVSHLRQLGVIQAWASSYEALLHRDISAVNSRLAAACAGYPELVAVAAVNPTLPGWREDLRQCVDVHQMPGIRLYPTYHGYSLADPRLDALLALASSKNLFVQIAVTLEDPRTQHLMMQVPDLDLEPLAAVMHKHATLRVQLLGARFTPQQLISLASIERVFFDTARLDQTDSLAEVMQSPASTRIMLGSHAPLLIPEAVLIRLDEYPLEDASVRKVTWQNAEAFLAGEKLSAFQSSGQRTSDRASDTNRRFGLPSTDRLRELHIWDCYFTPSHSHPGPDGFASLFADIERSMSAIEAGCFEKLCYFAHVGIGTTGDDELEHKLRAQPKLVTKPLDRWPQKLISMLHLNGHDVPASLAAIDRWIGAGPMVGVYLPGGGPGAIACTHNNVMKLVERVSQLGGVIIQHTWNKTGGKRGAGESTPAELAVLAKHFPNQKFICAHAGGEWQRGIRAVRDQKNVLVETSGFDATAGFIEMAVRELGPRRVVFGSHLPSRSLGTELSKILAAEITDDDRRLILGGNFRQLMNDVGR